MLQEMYCTKSNSKQQKHWYDNHKNRSSAVVFFSSQSLIVFKGRGGRRRVFGIRASCRHLWRWGASTAPGRPRRTTEVRPCVHLSVSSLDVSRRCCCAVHEQISMHADYAWMRCMRALRYACLSTMPALEAQNFATDESTAHALLLDLILLGADDCWTHDTAP